MLDLPTAHRGCEGSANRSLELEKPGKFDRKRIAGQTQSRSTRSARPLERLPPPQNADAVGRQRRARQFASTSSTRKYAAVLPVAPKSPGIPH